MLNYDVVVMGAGLSGLSAALRCLQLGLKTAVVSSGQSAMHFSSGSIDLLAHSPVTGQAVRLPYPAIDELTQACPMHPYAKLGADKVRQAMQWFGAMMAEKGLPMRTLGQEENHLRLTTVGTLKPAWFSQPYALCTDFDGSALSAFHRITVVSIAGFRDFHPNMTRDYLAQQPMFTGKTIRSITVDLPSLRGFGRQCGDLRSIDLSRLLRQPHVLNEFAHQLLRVSQADDAVVIPAVLGNGDGLILLEQLRVQTQRQLFEVATMPPSLMGIRIEECLTRAVRQLGGVVLKGDSVVGGELIESESGYQLEQIYTEKMSKTPLRAAHYIMATGSFFSGGLVAERQAVQEPRFHFDVSADDERDHWANDAFFAADSQPFLAFGVKTNADFSPLLNGETVRNVRCVGALLQGFDPIKQGCGGGVAISTAYHAATAIAKSHQHAAFKEEVEV